MYRFILTLLIQLDIANVELTDCVIYKFASIHFNNACTHFASYSEKLQDLIRKTVAHSKCNLAIQRVQECLCALQLLREHNYFYHLQVV